MQTMPPPNTSNVFIRQGLIFGVIVGVGNIILTQITGAGLGTIGLLLIVILWLGGYFWAGVQGAKLTGQIATGTLAGLFTALFAGTIAFFYWIILTASGLSALSSLGPVGNYTSGQAMGAVALCGLGLWVLGIGFGSGLGALGGLLGRSQSPFQPAPVAPPYAGQQQPYGYGQPPMQQPTSYYPGQNPPPYQGQMPPQYPGQNPPPYQGQMPPQYPGQNPPPYQG